MEEKEEKQFIDVKCVASNKQTISRVRNLLSIFSGSIAGILGLTGFRGFFLYIFLYLIASVGLLMKMQFEPGKYFPKATLNGFFIDGIGGQLVPYIMYWTLLYTITHIY